MLNVFSQVFATLMFSLILSGYASPVLTILLFACAHAVLTTLTLSKISKSVIIDRVGIAFGIVEVMDAIGNFVGHSLYGYLYELSGNYDLSMSLLYYSCIIATLTTFILSVAEMQTLFIRSRYCNIAL